MSRLCKRRNTRRGLSRFNTSLNVHSRASERENRAKRLMMLYLLFIFFRLFLFRQTRDTFPTNISRIGTWHVNNWSAIEIRFSRTNRAICPLNSRHLVATTVIFVDVRARMLEEKLHQLWVGRPEGLRLWRTGGREGATKGITQSRVLPPANAPILIVQSASASVDLKCTDDFHFAKQCIRERPIDKPPLRDKTSYGLSARPTGLRVVACGKLPGDPRSPR